MADLFEYPIVIVLVTLFIVMVVIHFQQTNKKRKEKHYKGHRHSSSRRYLEIETLSNRIDKLEVDVAYIKDFTIKKKVKEMKPNNKPSTPIDKKAEIKSELINLLKKEKKSKKFSDKTLMAEIERKCPNTAYTLTAEQYKKEYKKAYQRLWARKKYNHLK